MRMLATRLDKPGKVKLGDIPTNATGGMTEQEARERLLQLAPKLDELQELLYAAGDSSLLVVVQGMDTAGKDGTLKAIAGAMNPVGVRVASFKAPSPEELSHDFLWRVHQQMPAKGEVVFFNRSHYEDVLVVRVHNLVPKSVWDKRYAHINDFETMLHDSGTTIVKIFLHISKEEQHQRLLAREADASKAWKLNPGDWQERSHWDDYQRAYEAALGKCASKNAPWYIVPADHKWFRNVAVAELLIQTLKAHRPAWQAKLARIGEERRAALAALRAAGGVE